MYKRYIHSLIHSIGGSFLPGESQKEYLHRVAVSSGITPPALRTTYYGQDTEDGGYLCNNGQPISKNTRLKLEQAAENARQNQAIIAFTKRQLAIWETAPECYGPWIDAAREFLSALGEDAQTLGKADRLARNQDVSGEG